MEVFILPEFKIRSCNGHSESVESTSLLEIQNNMFFNFMFDLCACLPHRMYDGAQAIISRDDSFPGYIREIRMLYTRKRTRNGNLPGLRLQIVHEQLYDDGDDDIYKTDWIPKHVVSNLQWVSPSERQRYIASEQVHREMVENNWNTSWKLSKNDTKHRGDNGWLSLMIDFDPEIDIGEDKSY